MTAPFDQAPEETYPADDEDVVARAETWLREHRITDAVCPACRWQHDPAGPCLDDVERAQHTFGRRIDWRFLLAWAAILVACGALWACGITWIRGGA